MATITVTTKNDVVDAGDGVISLREAIAQASATAAADKITFSSNLLTAGSARIELQQGELAITQGGGALTIDGDLNNDGRPDIVIDAGGESRVMSITGTSVQAPYVSLEGLVIEGGNVTSGSLEGAGLNVRNAVLSLTSVVIENNQIRNNTPHSDTENLTGAGLSLVGSLLSANNTVFRNNKIYGSDNAFGAGLYIKTSEVNLTNTEITQNRIEVDAFYGPKMGGPGLMIVNASLYAYKTDIHQNQTSSQFYSSIGALQAQNSNLDISHSYIGNHDRVGGILANNTGTYIEDSIISNNQNNVGGGIQSVSGSLQISRSTIAYNRAVGEYGVHSAAAGTGGAIAASDLTLVDSTIFGNTTEGGNYPNRFDHDGSTVLAPNVSGFGAAVSALRATIVGSTIVSNRAGGLVDYYSGEVFANGVGGLDVGIGKLTNSIVAGNGTYDEFRGTRTFYGRDISGAITSNGRNIFSQSGITGAQPSDLIIDPDELFTRVLGPLADNGGPTPTHALLPGSPALNAGANADALGPDGLPLTSDQRGFPRIQGGTVDIGAVEGVGGAVVVAAVNAGGPAYGAIDGTAYARDNGFTGGAVATRAIQIAGTADNVLYQSERWGKDGFAWDKDLANGRYFVTLQFAETFFEAAGRRVFDVAIEGVKRVDDLDVYRRVGGDRALDLTFAVEVTDGHLDLDFIKQIGSPIVNAIKVERAYVPPARDSIAIDAGGPGLTTLDGTVFQADQYFSGGNANTVANPIAGTLDDALYKSERWAPGPLAYDVPVDNGDYVVTLHFAELFHNVAGKTFDVALEGLLRLDDLDIWSEVGKFAALEIALPVNVADGVLDLDFARGTRNPTIAGIEITPVGPASKAVNVGGPAYTSADGTAYTADAGFSASNVVTKTLAIAGTSDDTLYQSERWSRTGFSYDADVADGDYFLTLQFAETFHTAAGRRVFDVRVEGEVLVDDLDIYGEVGFATALDVTVGVTVSDGHLDVDFLPLLGAPKLNALKLVPVESDSLGGGFA